MNQFKCPSYYDNDNVLQDCTCGKCGKCGTPDKVEEIVAKLTKIAHPQDLGEPTSKLENAIREELTQYHQDMMRCGKELEDGSVCGVIKDCHLHDWRQKEQIQDLMSEMVEAVEGMKRQNAKLGGRSQVDERDNYFFNLGLTEAQNIIKLSK